MEISFAGAADEVGRSAIVIENKEKILLDYGLKLSHNEEPEYPLKVNPNHVFISHAHLDHIGAVPFLNKHGYVGNFYTTDLTIDLMRVMLEDSAKIAKMEGYNVRYSKKDVRETLNKSISVPYNKTLDFRNFSATFVDAGHIPGSAGIVIETGGKRIFYTGDLRVADTRLVSGMKEFPKADALVIESTYAERSHPDRKEEEKRFLEAVRTTLESGGVALIPAFALGRSQEMLMILEDLEYPMYVDGMAREATNIIKNYKSYLKDGNHLSKLCENIGFVKDNRQREQIIEEPCAIVTTAGFVQAGPSVFYIRKLCLRKNSSILIPGFQVEGSPGKQLLEHKTYNLDGETLNVGLRVDKFDFSAHGDREELLHTINKINPEKVFVIHGDNCEKFASELNGMGFESFAPQIGNKFSL
ncbi:MAG: MBL fold metallo-hydrolase [Candidatus Aenigmarchaeota archaeon]|nr:MBL fold metallo-hydrolase [Candidatus Aenigmarchaeota archaeon]